MNKKVDNSCQSCNYKQINKDENLHCYMFRQEPEHRCMKHSAFKRKPMVTDPRALAVLTLTSTAFGLGADSLTVRTQHDHIC